MLEQAREHATWIANASIKFPCTREGLRAVEVASREMPVNITLVFSQAQAAAVYSATSITEKTTSDENFLESNSSSDPRSDTPAVLGYIKSISKNKPSTDVRPSHGGLTQTSDSSKILSHGSFSEEIDVASSSAARAKYPVFISPFVGRLDDRGEVGMDLISNILRMFKAQSSKLKAQNKSKIPNSKSKTAKKTHPSSHLSHHTSHIQVLTASVRNLDHLMYALYLGSDIVTLPFEILEEWARADFKLPDENYKYETKGLKPIDFNNSVKLGLPWQEYDLSHPLTTAGVKKFWDDWQKIVS
jgi:transaldolase